MKEECRITSNNIDTIHTVLDYQKTRGTPYKNKKKIKRSVVVIGLIILLFIVIFSGTVLNNSIGKRVPSYTRTNQITSTLQKYPLVDLGIVINPLNWEGTGSFEISINATFDLNNVGPAMLVLDFSSQGDAPDSPGYEITGKFNGEYFEGIIGKPIIPAAGNEETVRQIAIPFAIEGRIFSNRLELTFHCSSSFQFGASGSLIIEESSHLSVGDMLVIHSFGNFPSSVYPANWEGKTTIGGTKLLSFIQFTTTNETLIQDGQFTLTCKLRSVGEISISLSLLSDTEEFAFESNTTLAGETTATVALNPELGENWYSIELTVFGDSIWSTEFSCLFESCNILVEEKTGGGLKLGFDNLTIPFFRWPDTPIIGIVILVLWVMPYSILKYREWKKAPDEVALNAIDEEEEDDSDIFPPEGLTAGDDDIVDDEFDFVEEL